MSQKIKDLIAIFLIQLVLTLPFYTASVYGLTISNARVTKVTSNTATIDWLTDDASNGKVKYGKTTSLGFSERHENFVDNHSLNIVNAIDSGTTYFFSVESSDLAGNTAVDNNSNSFYTFKTADITPPPQVTGLQAVSKTSSSIFLSWNGLDTTDLSHYLIYRNRVAVANSMANSFNDTGVSSGSLSYKVSAVDTSGNEGVSSDTIIVSALPFDAAVPIISNVDALSITDTTARITWLTDENSTTIVLFGINKTDKTKSSTDLVTNHTISIDGLVKNTNYFFIAKSCDASNNCANLSKNFIAVKDIKPPFINLSTPGFVNRRVVDLIGSTEPFSQITLFVNNMNIPKRSLSNAETGNSGKFAFSQVQLEQDNLIKLVAVDKSGNRNQKIFEVSVDTQGPVVQLDELPSLTSKINLTVKGSVNEQVLINVFVDAKANESAVPDKIAGLNATKLGQNFVELHWDESKDKDFSHYVVYREDASPIATTKPANFNLYIDALVESGRSYTYQVSAVNIFANEGPKSEPVTVTTLSGGATLGIKPPDVDIFEDFRKPLMILNGSGSFNFGIKLNKGDGDYFIKLIFEDRAKNSVVIEKSIALDTKKPEVKIISPPSGALVFENVANNVDIIGRTKPNAKVHLFVDRTPFSSFNQTFETNVLPLPIFSADEIQNIPEIDLDAKCRLNVASRSFCRTGADFSETADENGNFKFKNVDLTTSFGGAARLREVPVTEFRDERLEEGKDAKTTTLVVIATDATGQRGFATQRVNIGTCWSGNQSWDIIPLTRFQSPTFLSTERMAEGTETIYFYFNYSYIGRGTNARITSVSLSKACGARELMDPRFNISCQIMPSGGSPKLLNPPDNTLSYSAVQLARFPGMDRFLEKDWKNFLKAINKELTFPMRVRITYKHDTDNDGQLETETQQTCEQVSYTVDSTIIDPRKFLPDWLLFDFVDFLQSSIKGLTQVQEQIDRLVDFVAVGCMASGGLNLVMQVYRRWTDFWIEKTYSILTKENFATKISELPLKNPLKTATPNDSKEAEDCQKLINDIVNAKGSFRLKYVNDIDLKKCFPASDYAWETEANTYSWLRWSCDRIFGHAAPAAWTENKGDEDLLNRISKGESCPVDESVIGQPLKIESCTEFARKRPTFKAAETFGRDAKCTLVQTKESGKNVDEVYTVRELVPGSEKLYQLSHITLQGALSSKSIYAVKKSEFDYITAQTKSCAEICGVKGVSGKSGTFKGADGKEFTVIKPSKDEPQKSTKDTKKSRTAPPLYSCTTTNDCLSFNANKEVFFGQESFNVDLASPKGYTSDCFYDSDRNTPSVVSDNPAQRVECCCINAKEGPSSKYYQPDDVDPITGAQVHKSKKDISGGEVTKLGENDYANVDWSYRYWKEKFEVKGKRDGQPHNEYNKNRYIEGRDLPACFGQNNWLYEYVLQKPETVLTVDPFRQHESALQCAHLTGISNRIQFVKNLMTSLSTCLIQVRTTGRGDAGACKELFTQYLCNAIWQIIRFFVDGCTPSGLVSDIDKQSDTILTSVKAGFSSVYESITDFQRGITQEYGNAKLNEILGTGEESIARKICLGAFGYDWEINVRNIVDAAYATPFATLVQPITRSREFLTVDPVKYAPKYEYRASWIINPGCDFERYDVYLTCVGRKQLDQYSNQINCGALGAPSIGYTGALGTSVGYSQCDCIGLQDERRGPSVFSGRLKQNILEEKAIPSGKRVIDDNVRYDHLKFVLRTDRKIQPNIKPNCFPQGYDDGVFYFPLIDKTAHDIFDCRLDELSGSFICGEGGTFASRKGIAYFTSVKINDRDPSKTEDMVFTPGESLAITATVFKAGKDKCIKATLDNVIVDVVGVTINGTHDYTLATPPLSLGQRERIVKPSFIEIVEKSLVVEDDFTIEFKFYDVDNNGFIDFFNDEVDIDGSLDGEGKVPIQQSKHSDTDGKITIDKKGAKIQIVSVAIPKTIDGTPISKEVRKEGNKEITIGIAQGVILVRKAQPATSVSQVQGKTLLLELFNLKENADSWDGNPTNCEFNDAVIYPDKPQKRGPIRIRIEQTLSKEALAQGPRIERVTVTPSSRVRKGQPVTISVKFENHLLVDKAEFSYTRPDGVSDVIPLVKKDLQGIFETETAIPTDSFTVAGTVNGKITAIGKNQKPSEYPVKFEIQCGDSNTNVFGTCRESCGGPSNIISSEIRCIEMDFGEEQQCCRTS